MRFRFHYALMSAVVAAGAFASSMAVAGTVSQFDIPAQPLADALRAVGNQTNLNVFFDPKLVAGFKAPALQGEASEEQALQQLLAGTGLTYRQVDEKTFTIVSVQSVGETKTSLSAPDIDGGANRIHLAQTAQGESSAVGGSTSKNAIEEVIVTAQKRTERLQDVPVPVTALRTDMLVDTGQLRLQDYYSQIPGLSLTVGDGRGMPMLSIRGITSGYTNPTVGVVVDDAPFGASTNFALGAMVPDIDPSELARVEVLRGPQGTLYGASSMGGLFKYVTIDPSTEGFTGRVQGGFSSVRNGDELGYNVSGSVNIPLSQTFAVRVNGYSRRDAGYIDDPVRGIDGVNSADYEGGRISALWRPTENLSLKLSALLQESKTNGLSRVDLQAGFEDLQQSTLPGTGWLDKRIAAYTANLTAKLGPVEMTAISGYNVSRFYDSYDLTPSLGGSTEALFGVSGAPLFDFIKTTKITEELRFSVPIGQRLEWLLGAFYTDEDNELEQQLYAQDDAGAFVGSWFDGNNPSTFEELAFFTDLTIQVTDRFDVQVGGRESRIRQTTSGISVGPLVGGVSIAIPTDTKANAFTYLLTPRFKVSPDLMVYARLASGYRAGLPNGALVPGAPAASSPDKTKNYELGIKGNALNNVLSFDVSLYRIDWTGIQMQVIDSLGRGYFTNGSDARSEGVELSLEAQPFAGLTIAGWVAWSDAALSESFPVGSTNFGLAGYRLPYSTRLSGNFSLEKEFPLGQGMTGFAGGAVSYVGDRLGYFRSTSLRQVLPSYTKMDLRAGVRFDSWTANLFVNNVADKRGVLTGGLDSTPSIGFTYVQPRTFGMSLSKTF